MRLYVKGVPERVSGRISKRVQKGFQSRGRENSTLRALAAVMLTLASGISMPPAALAQQANKAASNLPAAPAPEQTTSSLRQSLRDFSKPAGTMLGNPLKPYLPTQIDKASFVNSVRLDNLLKDGKIYLSLSDALALAIENNYDIAIARYNLDIADTDILRARAGSTLLGVNSGVISNTLGGATSTLSAGGGPGGTTVGSGGAASGTSGIVSSTNGAGPTPEALDPTVTGTIQLERAKSVNLGLLEPSVSTNTNQYNFTYNQGFVTGTALQVAWDTSRIASNGYNSYSPYLSTTFKATITQNLLQGFGIYINKRFMYQAMNDRRIVNSSFRQQILYTVNQVENIYWGLVSAYEDVQAKQQKLDQSTELENETQKELQIGTMAPLDVVNAQSTVATDKQALISSENTLQYQQLIMKQAIARNLSDPGLIAAPIVPTDRISLDEIPEEHEPVDELVATAFKKRPELEQAVLQLRNDEITLKGANNALLPQLNVYGFYSGSGIGGSPNTSCNFDGFPCGATTGITYGTAFNDLVNSAAPDKGIGFSLTVPLRNRTAQAEQARSLLEYRQAELRLEQLYTEIRIQVVNAQYALTNDRAQVLSARAAYKYNQQSLDAEEKKLRLGASTTQNVLVQESDLATARNNLIAAEAAYAKDRAGLFQMLATTLDHYGINLGEAVTGQVGTTPAVPGLQPASDIQKPASAQ